MPLSHFFFEDFALKHYLMIIFFKNYINDLKWIRIKCKTIGGIPYTDHGAQIPLPLIFDFCLFFVCMLILGWVKVRFAPQC